MEDGLRGQRCPAVFRGSSDQWENVTDIKGTFINQESTLVNAVISNNI